MSEDGGGVEAVYHGWVEDYGLTSVWLLEVGGEEYHAYFKRHVFHGLLWCCVLNCNTSPKQMF